MLAMVLILSSYLAIAQQESIIEKKIVLSSPGMNTVSIRNVKYKQLSNAKPLLMDNEAIKINAPITLINYAEGTIFALANFNKR